MNPNLIRTAAAMAGTAALLVACGSSSSSSTGSASGATAATTASSSFSSGPGDLLIAINAPTTANPFEAGVLQRGANLAVSEINAKGGVDVAGVKHKLVVKTYDDGLDPARSASNVRQAIADGAVGIIEDGSGATISAADSAAAGVPEVVVFTSNVDLTKGQASIFRLGISNEGAADTLAKYVGSHGSKKPAIVHEDTASARDAKDGVIASLATEQLKPLMTTEIAANAPVNDADLVAIKTAGADGLVVWGTDTFTARVVKQARADGLTMPIYAGPSGESPLVRQFAGTAAEGMFFVTSRETSENDVASFPQFEHRLAAATGGPIDAGVKDSQGREIRQPATYETFSYDAVNVLAAAITKSGAAKGSKDLLAAMTTASVTSANGDHRGFNPDNHEGLNPDDVYVAVIKDNVFAPVKDEPLSASLPVPDEILANFH